MRIRTIKPEFWTHPVMMRLNDECRLVAIALLNYADDEGYFYADPAMVRGALFPLKGSTNIRRSIDELSRIGYLEVKNHTTHGLLGRVVNFTSHQRIDRPKPSKAKELWESTTNRRRIDERSTLEQGREQGTGKGKEAPPNPPKGGSGDAATDLPHGPLFAEQWALWKQYRREKRKTLTPTSEKRQLAKLAKLDEDHAIATLDASITNGWQGLFPEKVEPRVNGRKRVEDCL